MKKLLLIAALMLSAATANAEWKLAGDKIHTRWAEEIDVNNVHPEYPRPIMERENWVNLNGLWNYAITSVGSSMPQNYEGEILVPFAVESALSGVGRTVGAGNELWYERSFTVPSAWKGKRVMLNFGAVDWKCEVWVNDIKVGTHTGGFTSFSMDVTAALKNKGENVLTVCVWDPTDEGYQPRGKQVKNPSGIWYTPVTGIWQTVWLEPVNDVHIADVRILPNIDKHTVTVEAPNTAENKQSVVTSVKVFDAEGNVVATAATLGNSPIKIEMPADARLWSPNDPYIYDITVELTMNGKVVDQIKSYTAMRKISTARDKNGVVRMQLNNKDLFHFGPLDQGWWPDGLYTAPTHEAMVYDIEKTKDLGFNMIRKHIKVEPATWYTACDRLGVLVWQDMPSGDHSPQWQNRNYFNGTELIRSEESEANYRKEWKEIIDLLYSYPSIVMWVPFNEAWGQFKTEDITKWTKEYDPSRLVNPASGGNFYPVGDVLDLHNYPAPDMYLYDPLRVNVLGEYGGIGYVVKEHIWFPDRNWGYVQFNSPEEVTNEYVKYAEMLLDYIKRGFRGAVYTQTTDVEVEVNGFMTYDRAVLKMDEKRVNEINTRIVNSLSH